MYLHIESNYISDSYRRRARIKVSLQFS